VDIKWCACCREATQFKEDWDQKYDWKRFYGYDSHWILSTNIRSRFFSKEAWLHHTNEETRRKACECMNAHIYMSQVAQTDASEASSESSKA
jgi:hypothetical protein